MKKITQALLSVSDKNGLLEFARGLHALGIRLLSTGGTAKLLQQAGLPVTEIADYTGFAEMLDGRVKTLHPKVHGGILARRDRDEHLQAIAQHDIECIDLVVVNLYPFAATVARDGVAFAEAIEQIDIGGPAMVRAAAKNHGDDAGGVGVVTNPADYDAVLQELRSHDNALSTATRRRLAASAFAHTARYDGAIANYFTGEAGISPWLDSDIEVSRFPACLQLSFDKAAVLRYGENPHQGAAFYRDPDVAGGGIAHARQIQGKTLSYNNLADADAAWSCAQAFAHEKQAVCVIVKHANPCGVALAADAEAAYRRAFATDPTSAFGGIIAFASEVDEKCARALGEQFLEVLIAPSYSSAALEVLAAKTNVRVLQCPPGISAQFDYKRIGGGLLVQDSDNAPFDPDSLSQASARAPDASEHADLLFAWRVAQYVKSNAIVYCKDGATVGIGAGQMSRVDSARIAAIKAQNAGLEVRGSVVASDAFFPFRDGLDVLAEAGATAVIQPGGSVRDAEVINAADEHKIAMLFTGTRHFRH